MLENIIKKISLETGLSKEEILDKINEKQDELSGLISEEGAAYMVAKELGIEFEKPVTKIKDIKPDTKNVEVIAKIKKIFVKDFETEKGSGRVANLILEDDTGSIRLSLWNKETDLLEEIKEGDVIKVKGYTKKDGTDQPQLRLGYYGNISKLDINIKTQEPKRMNIKDLQYGQQAEIRAALLQLFETDLFYEVCPYCRSRLKDSKCPEHGKVNPDYEIVLSGIIDDGTGNMRVVMFGSCAEKVLGAKKEEIENVKELFKNVLGKEFIFQGRVRKNKFFDRPEFITNNVKSVNVIKEIERMLGE